MRRPNTIKSTKTLTQMFETLQANIRKVAQVDLAKAAANDTTIVNTNLIAARKAVSMNLAKRLSFPLSLYNKQGNEAYITEVLIFINALKLTYHEAQIPDIEVFNSPRSNKPRNWHLRIPNAVHKRRLTKSLLLERRSQALRVLLLADIFGIKVNAYYLINTQTSEFIIPSSFCGIETNANAGALNGPGEQIIIQSSKRRIEREIKKLIGIRNSSVEGIINVFHQICDQICNEELDECNETEYYRRMIKNRLDERITQYFSLDEELVRKKEGLTFNKATPFPFDLLDEQEEQISQETEEELRERIREEMEEEMTLMFREETEKRIKEEIEEIEEDNESLSSRLETLSLELLKAKEDKEIDNSKLEQMTLELAKANEVKIRSLKRADILYRKTLMAQMQIQKLEKENKILKEAKRNTYVLTYEIKCLNQSLDEQTEKRIIAENALHLSNERLMNESIIKDKERLRLFEDEKRLLIQEYEQKLDNQQKLFNQENKSLSEKLMIVESAIIDPQTIQIEVNKHVKAIESNYNRDMTKLHQEAEEIRNSLIKEYENKMQSKDTTLMEKEISINEQQKTIEENNKLYLAKLTEIDQREDRVIKLMEKLNEKTFDLKGKEYELNEKEEQLDEKEQELNEIENKQRYSSTENKIVKKTPGSTTIISKTGQRITYFNKKDKSLAKQKKDFISWDDDFFMFSKILGADNEKLKEAIDLNNLREKGYKDQKEGVYKGVPLRKLDKKNRNLVYDLRKICKNERIKQEDELLRRKIDETIITKERLEEYQRNIPKSGTLYTREELLLKQKMDQMLGRNTFTW